MFGFTWSHFPVCKNMPVCLPVWLPVPPPLYSVSAWQHNKPAFMLERRGAGSRKLVSTQQTISNRANIQYQATCTVSGATHSYLLSSLAPVHLLCISAFRSPTALWFMFPSLSLLRFRQRWLWWTSFYVYPKNHKTRSLAHTPVHQHAPTQMLCHGQM